MTVSEKSPSGDFSSNYKFSKINMLRKLVKLEDLENTPQWAVFYFRKNIAFYYAMLRCKKSKRSSTYENMVEEGIFSPHQNIYFNKKGNAVFFWPSPCEKLFFLLKWSN